MKGTSVSDPGIVWATFCYGYLRGGLCFYRFDRRVAAIFFSTPSFIGSAGAEGRQAVAGVCWFAKLGFMQMTGISEWRLRICFRSFCHLRWKKKEKGRGPQQQLKKIIIYDTKRQKCRHEGGKFYEQFAENTL
jgi:hypothetical protein